jgi:hypothetical protein
MRQRRARDAVLPTACINADAHAVKSKEDVIVVAQGLAEISLQSIDTHGRNSAV